MHLILASQSVGRKNLLKLLNIPFEIIPSSLDEDKIVGKTPLETLKLRAKLKGEEVLKKVMSYELLVMRNNSPITHHPQPITIISADSGAILDNQLIGKPKDYNDAFRIMKTLSGRTHRLVTAVYLSWLPRSLRLPKLLMDKSLVTFRRLFDEDIRIYLKKTDYTRYAGGYALFACPPSALADQPALPYTAWLAGDQCGRDCPGCRFPTLKELTGNLGYHSLLKKTCQHYDQNHGKNAHPPDFIQSIKGSLSNVIGLPLEKLLPHLITNNPKLYPDNQDLDNNNFSPGKTHET